jgi:phosphoribosylformylglycinamidine synthase I
MLAAVVQFPGSNADFDAFYTLSRVLGVPTKYVFHKDVELPPGTDLVVLPGGFSYGDYLRCGAIARFAHIMAAVQAHADRGGLLLGICNGFQILTETGILPGALTRNAHLRFECRDVTGPGRRRGCVHPGDARRVLRLPIAHAEGRYQADAATIETLEREGRVALPLRPGARRGLPCQPQRLAPRHRRDLRRPAAQRAGAHAAPRARVGAHPRQRRRREPALPRPMRAALVRA